MKNIVKLSFLGAAGVVTGSKFLIETSGKNLLIDCGLFQGLKTLRELNWQSLSVDVPAIDLVLLTHGHLDHVGYLPRLLQQGFQGQIIGTAPTLAIAEIILRDAAKIQEEEAEKANAEQYSKHKPALALYTLEDVEATLKLFQAEQENTWIDCADQIAYRFKYNGHIIGACFIELDLYGKRFVFSGDIGRPNDYLLEDPKRPKIADVLLIESTYGNKLHPKEDLETLLSQLILETIHNRGQLIIPSFAVERLQTLMYMLWRLYKKNKIPNIPIFIDSPMGNNVLEVFHRFPKWHKLSEAEYQAMCDHMHIISSYRDTWNTIDDPRAKIIIAGSGMLTGGRVLTYIQQLIDEPTTTILLVGYQAEGTRGRQLQDGAHEIKCFGKYYPVKARIKTIESLSAHADQQELLDWMHGIENTPEHVFLIHGESTAQDVFRIKIQDLYGWQVSIPKLGETQTLTWASKKPLSN